MDVMARITTGLALVVFCMSGLVASHARAGDASAALSEARQALDAGQPSRAVALLEAQLIGVSPEIRPALLDLLREAYPPAIAAAEKAGKSREAASLRENLKILSPAATRPAAAAPPTEPAAAPAPPKPIAEAVNTPPASDLVAAASPPPSILGAEPPVSQPPAIKPVAAPTLPAPRPTEITVDAADSAFRDKQYAEAGRIYSALAARNALPPIRRDPWAYCRMYDVVRRLNESPATDQEWKAIQAEILEIRKISPKMWYAEYLRRLVVELTTKPRSVAGNPDRLVVRGASPEEPPPAARQVRREPPPPGGPTVGQAGAPVNNWQVWETTNFRIFHGDEKLATQVAQIAESTRQGQQRLWARQEQAPTWEPRCDIYLYPTAAVFSQMTGQPADSPGFSTMGLNQGHVIARRVNLRADHAGLLNAVLPHEVTHIVLADLFPNMQIPRWADEGLAVLAEPANEQQLRAGDLVEPLSSGVLFPVEDLMKMDYPDGKYWSLYYAQSVSLTRYLVEMGTPGQFVEFVQGSQRRGVEAELKRVYRIESFTDLQTRWLSYAQTNAKAATTARLASETVDATRR
jgi:hypothetical protein